MRIITKNIRWLALMEVYNTAKFDHSAKNRSRDIVLTERCTEKKKEKKRIRKAKTEDLHLHADLKKIRKAKTIACRSKYVYFSYNVCYPLACICTFIHEPVPFTVISGDIPVFPCIRLM